MQPADLLISSDPALLERDMIHQFLSTEAYWSLGIPRETLDKAIDGSLCFGLYSEGRQIAFARLITDGATFAYLCDVFVLPAWRGQGHARHLLNHIFALPQMQGLRRIVLVTGDAHHVYRPLGFKTPAHPERYMEIHRPDIYRS